MVKQGDIILINFDPVRGHEQGKTRPAIVVSSDGYNNICGGLAIVCPISHANDFPLHVKLPEGLKTDGSVLCQHAKTFDIEARGYRYIESVPSDFKKQIVDTVKACF